MKKLLAVAALASLFAGSAVADVMDDYKGLVRASLDLARSVKEGRVPSRADTSPDVVDARMADCHRYVVEARNAERDPIQQHVVRDRWKFAALSCRVGATSFCGPSYDRYAWQLQCKAILAMPYP